MTPAGHYSECKDSGTDWLGEIPAHWDMVKLKNGFDLQKRPAVKSAGIVTAFRDGQVTLRSNRRIDGYTEGDKQIGYQTIHPGDLVIHAMDAFAGAIGVSDSFGQSTPVYSVCTPKSGFNAYFYARALRHIALTGYITSLAKGVRERSTDFRWADAKELPVPRPPIEEQNKIVAFLDRETARIDDLIGKQERLMELLAEKRQAVITHAVTRGLGPTAPTKPSGIPWLGEIPARWKVSRLKWTEPLQESGTSVNGVDAPAGPGEIGVLKTGAVSKGFFDPEANKTVVLEDIDRVSCAVRKGTLIVNRANTPDLVGSTGRTTIDLPTLFLSDKLWQVDFERADTNFIFWWSKTDVYRSQIQFRRVGASSSMQNLSYPDFLTVDIALPAPEEQQIIAKSIDDRTASLDFLRDKARKAVVLLRERRSALISAAVTGKIDVREGVA